MSPAQALIGLLGGLAVWLVTSRRPGRRRLGCALGLLSQPLWVYETWRAGQVGMLLLSLWYTLAWARGLWGHR